MELQDLVKSSFQCKVLFKLFYKVYTLRRKGSMVFGTPKRFYTLLKKGSSRFYIEPWGSILGQ